MTTFDDRERAFESQFARDQELQFKVGARRNRLLGEWAAGLLGKSGDEIDTYCKEVVRSDFAEAGDDDVLRKVAGDLQGKVEESEVRKKMDELMITARQQLQTGG